MTSYLPFKKYIETFEKTEGVKRRRMQNKKKKKKKWKTRNFDCKATLMQ